MMEQSCPPVAADPRYSIECDNEGGFAFVNRFFKIYRSEYTKSIVQKRDGKIIAAVVYQEWNGSNMFIHVAAEPGEKWGGPEMLYWVFNFPFAQVGAKRLTGWVSVNNKRAQEFDEGLGFKREATLKGAGEYGEDVILYVMHREDCPYGGVNDD